MKVVEVNLNEKQLDKEFRRLSKNLGELNKKQVPLGVSRVINREAEKAKTKTVRGVARVIGVKQKTIRERIRLSRSRPKKLVAKLWGGQNAISALSAGAKKTQDGFKLGQYQWDDAFVVGLPTNRINGGYSGKPVIFYRDPTKPERGPQRESNRNTGYPLNRAEIGQKFVAKEVRKAMDSVARDTVNKNLTPALNKELQFRINRQMGKK